MAGILTGNLYYAVKKYIVLISEVRRYCKSNKIGLIVLGPPERLLSKSEPLFCRYLIGKVERFCSTNDVVFINGLTGSENGNRIKILDGTGKFATKEYHDLVAEKLFTGLNLPL
jgi:hypothetical protein